MIAEFDRAEVRLKIAGGPHIIFRRCADTVRRILVAQSRLER